ncbi:hypothetical protein [Duganella vulcania]|uniref:Uncharacterized protein n=1 Tax=Duganella vulcania TaxID=2692166 RepID=A0A845GGQ4_9BURK|nr:hypothetical protein [Duganella vulcania]MYM92602.1 hypothetical protein [Duganella vulcania]
MASIDFTAPAFLQLKRDAARAFPHIKSSHLSEAIAASAGFATHAALLAALKNTNDASARDLDLTKLQSRLVQLGYPPVSFAAFENGAVATVAGDPPAPQPLFSSASDQLPADSLVMVDQREQNLKRLLTGESAQPPKMDRDAFERFQRLRARTVRQALRRAQLEPIGDDYCGVVSFLAEDDDMVRNLKQCIDAIWPKSWTVGDVRISSAWYRQFWVRRISSDDDVQEVHVEVEIQAPMTIRHLYETMGALSAGEEMMGTLRALPAARNPMTPRAEFGPPLDWATA